MSNETIVAQQYNEQFIQDMKMPDKVASLQKASAQYIKTELQEKAFSRAIIPQEPISTSDCQRNVGDTSLYVIRDIEPGVSALAVDNLGEPDGTYVRGERYTIPIVKFATKRFQITEDDLKSYQYKITKRIEDKSVPILEKLEDKFFLRMMGSTIAAGGKLAGGNGDTMANKAPQLNPTDHIALTSLLESGINGGTANKALEVGCLLMTRDTYKSTIMLPAYGDDFGKDRIHHGVGGDTLYGTKVIRTIKSDILPNGHVFAFTSPDFLGNNFAMGEPTFEIRSQFGTIEWQTVERIGMNVGNVSAAALLTMKGSNTPGAVPSTGNGDLYYTGSNSSTITNHYKNYRV